MCNIKTELDDLTKENLEEVQNTISDIKKGNMQIVGQTHNIKNMQFQHGLVPIGEQYVIEILYTCKICENRLNDIGICKLDEKYHEQICINFKRG